MFDESGFLDARHAKRVGDHTCPISSTVRTTRAATLGSRHVPRCFHDLGRFRERAEWYDAYFKELNSLETIGDFRLSILVSAISIKNSANELWISICPSIRDKKTEIPQVRYF